MILSRVTSDLLLYLVTMILTEGRQSLPILFLLDCNDPYMWEVDNFDPYPYQVAMTLTRVTSDLLYLVTMIFTEGRQSLPIFLLDCNDIYMWGVDNFDPYPYKVAVILTPGASHF